MREGHVAMSSKCTAVFYHNSPDCCHSDDVEVVWRGGLNETRADSTYAISGDMIKW